MSASVSKDRFEALRKLLQRGEASTQADLRETLVRQGFAVTQSTISRDLRRLGAIRTVDGAGRMGYHLAEEFAEPAPHGTRQRLADHVRAIQSNEFLIVIHTTLGSASLVARHLDHTQPGGILGTIAGDDTVFVVPPSIKNTQVVLRLIRESLGVE